MSTEAAGADNIIPFPPQLRVVPVEPSAPLPLEHAFALVEHDGCMYDLGALVRHLSPLEVQELGEAAPRSGQEMWDEVARRWPMLAAEIVAGVTPVG